MTYDGSGWEPCQEYGHRFQMDGEQYSTCIDCGEPRDDDDDDDDDDEGA